MSKTPLLRYDKGTLILYPEPETEGEWKKFVIWDSRIERYRAEGRYYAPLMLALRKDGLNVSDKARDFHEVQFKPMFEMEPYEHQREALKAWIKNGRAGVVVLPTGSGKTYLAQLAMQRTPRSTLVLVPTKPLLTQWYTRFVGTFPHINVGVLGGGDRDGISPDNDPPVDLLISTYTSAAIHAERLGNRYATIIFDECHNLPTDFYRVIAEFAIAPYRMGLSATPERSDNRHEDLDDLIGPQIYRREPDELSGGTLADYESIQIKVSLTQEERQEYDYNIETRNRFMRENGLSFGGNGWNRFVQASVRSTEGRRAMLAHNKARKLAFGASAKIRVLETLMAEHWPNRMIIFTNDNETVHTVSERFLLPAITHETPTKERHVILDLFRKGSYRAVVTSRVLNEGIDVPNAMVGFVLSGTGSRREYIQRLGRLLRRGDDPNKKAYLYEFVAEDTTEEGTSRRRRRNSKPGPVYHVNPQQKKFDFNEKE